MALVTASSALASRRFSVPGARRHETGARAAAKGDTERRTHRSASTVCPAHAHADAHAVAEADAEMSFDVETSIERVRVLECTHDEGLLRGCAALRVQCFYAYEPDPSIGDDADRVRLQWLDDTRRTEEARGVRWTELGLRVSSYAAVRRVSEADMAQDMTRGASLSSWSSWSCGR